MQPPSVDALVVASDHDGTIPRVEEKKSTALLVIRHGICQKFYTVGFSG